MKLSKENYEKLVLFIYFNLNNINPTHLDALINTGEDDFNN